VNGRPALDTSDGRCGINQSFKLSRHDPPRSD
jgi:hypothetical protein